MPLPKKIEKKLVAAGIDPAKITECGNCGCRSLHSHLLQGEGYGDECMNEESHWNATGGGAPTRCGCTDYAPESDGGYVFKIVDEGKRIAHAEIVRRGGKQFKVVPSEASQYSRVVPADFPQTPAEAVAAFVAEREAEIDRLRGEIEAARETHRRWDR